MVGAILAAAATLAFAPAPAAVQAAAGVPVSCVADAEWPSSFPAAVASAQGLYDTVNRVVYLRRAQCDRLALLATGARPTSLRSQYDFSSAVFLLGHEAAHAAGTADEREADCAAGRGFLRTAAALGVGRAYGRVLADYLVNARIAAACYPR